MRLRDHEVPPERLENDDSPAGSAGAESGGQSGDTQGLSSSADEAEESVEDLAETGQDFEAEIVEGMEDAADHPERPVHTHEDQRRSADFGRDRDSG